MPEPATATSTFPQPEQPEHETENPLQSSPYEALLRHIEEIEHAQLQMLGQVPFPDEAMEGHQEQLAMMPEEFADHHNAQLGTPSMATYVPPPRVLVFPPSQNPEDPMITSVTLGPDLQAGGLAGEAHRQPHFLRPRVPPPKVAVTYMKREWEPSLSVKKPLLRPDSGSTAWKLCAIKLNPTNRTLQVYGSDAISTTKFSIKDMEIPIRDPELSGHAPVAQYNLRNAVLEKASNAARSHTVRVRLMNGVSLVISFASAITLEEWALALTRTANDESGSMPMIRDGSGYVEYPSASSFHPLSAMAL
ncbi:hypothetical protein BC832DRAFT_419492 [Gaertneriomyces semiglobifer]|nr:hypothetical protein BC832DRAFT_419492 [Gaertneriomyces semiglobifer]